MDPKLRGVLAGLLEAYGKYREHCAKPVPHNPPQAFKVTVLLTAQLGAAIEAVLWQPGATTPHGLVSRQTAPFLDLILPPGDAQWDGRKRVSQSGR